LPQGAAQGPCRWRRSRRRWLDLLPWPKVDFAKFGPVERKELSRIKKISGANLHRNWVMIPHVTNHDDADITDLEAFRVQTNKENEKSGVKVTMLAFLIKACVAALKKFPEFNSSLDGDAAGLQAVLPHRLCGRHAQRPGGAGHPDADKKGILQISQGDGRAGQEGARRQAGPGRHERRLLLHQLAGRHWRHATSRPSSTRPKWPSWACARAAWSRCGTASSSCRA
jgi:pyruvate dehydrogenase E2 component (dihydrolipoamide acetyltransferase)